MAIDQGSAENAEQKEAAHRAAEARVTTFKYEKPETGKPKDHTQLVGSGLLRVAVQTVREGGENNLHYHVKSSETAWMVLHGRVRFYGIGDALLGEFGPKEGIFLPGGARYWFEKVGDEDLEILQMIGLDSQANGRASRINIEAHKDWMTEFGPGLLVYESDLEKENAR